MSKYAIAPRLFFLLFVNAACLLGVDTSVKSVDLITAGLTEQKDFPQIKLRGYGKLSGKSWTNGTGGSLLKITCQDAEHARLVQAKYLSDLGELPPATKPGEIEVKGAKVSIHTAESVGAVAALRNGTTVVIATAKTSDDLARLIGSSLAGEIGQWTSVAEGKVPMFLDRFDKYGFRFYYVPGEVKTGPDRKALPNYDVREGFDFMQANHAGLLVWHDAQAGETAEWLTKEPAWDWALTEARRKGLSFGINLGIGADWCYNRYPETLMQFAPCFLGTHYGSMNYGIGQMVSWCSDLGQDTTLGQLQITVRHLEKVDNITSWLEPHEELGGGVADLLIETGPVADANFRRYLREKYKTIHSLSKRYHGDTTTLTSWDQVHAPEPAGFLGWNGDALDLAGTWRISYAEADDTAALAPEFDDSAWGQMQGPGHGLARTLPPKPALWRRHFTVDAAWLTSHPAAWLYVWDMNDTRGANLDPAKAVVISLNGKVQPEERPCYSQDHWTALNVSNILKAGDNLLAIRLPRGVFNYRVYLSGSEPKSYPELGKEGNARWVDFSNWLSNLRRKGVRRGMQMIRQADPDRGIMLMAPDKYEDEVLEEAINYGGDFHNTGYMAGWWCDKLPALMRGAGLPFSTEPSQGPTLPIHLLGSFGNWITQGVNAIDHFQTLGEVLFHPDLKKCFEDHSAMYTSIGRYHAPVAQVAALYSNRINNLYGFPWNERPASKNNQPYFRGGGYPSGFNSRGFYSPMEHMPKGPCYESDAVTEMMLANNQAGKFRVIVDTDTAVLDEDAVNGIERFVRKGGVFVTYGETGRHSPEQPDSWPIQRITGFQVANNPVNNSPVALDASQQILTDWSAPGNMSGLKLNSAVPEATSILKWKDGSTAVGLRPLGKGYVVTVGLWFGQEAGNAFFSHLFQWLKIDPIPARLESTGPEVFWRHFLSNNGLYDLWVVRNTGSKQPAKGTLILANGLHPAWAIDLNSGTRSTVTDGRLPINLPSAEMAIYITPRTEIASSSSEWFNLQRGWWQGTADPGTPLPKPDMKLAMDITDGWAFQPVDAKQSDVSNLVAPTTDDSAWKQMSLGIFTVPDYPDVRHAVIRKHFRVPKSWNRGRTLLRLPGFRNGCQTFLDGQLLKGEPVLAGGSEHILAMDIRSTGILLGANGSGWLTYHPDPVAQQDLSGSWQPSTDMMTWDKAIPLPGPITQGVRALRQTVAVQAEAADRTVVLHGMEQSGELKGIVINGHFLKPNARESSELNLNVTQWVHPGQDNEIILLMGGSHETITRISLEFHKKGSYP